MQTAWLGSWLRYLLAWVGLVFVVSGWVIVTIAAKALERVNVGVTYYFRSRSFFVFRLGEAVLVAFLLVAPFMVMTGFPYRLVSGLALMSVFSLHLFDHCRRSEPVDAVEESFHSSAIATRRPADSWLSSLSNSLADFESCPPVLQGFGDRSLVREHVSGLIQDWLAGNAWKYRLVGVWLPSPRTVSPFGAVPEWWKVYQIALEDPSGLVKYGWVRFGAGRVNFQFEAEGQPDALRHDPFDPGRPEPALPAELLPVDVGRNPLWDRWIDG